MYFKVRRKRIFNIYPNISYFWCFSFFLKNQVSICCHFPLAQSTSFSVLHCSLVHVCWQWVLLVSCYLKTFSLGAEFIIDVFFSFGTLNFAFSFCLLVSIVSETWGLFDSLFPVIFLWMISRLPFYLWLSAFWIWHIITHRCDFLYLYPIGFADFLESVNICLSPDLGKSAIIFSNNISAPFALISPLEL